MLSSDLCAHMQNEQRHAVKTPIHIKQKVNKSDVFLNIKL